MLSDGMSDFSVSRLAAEFVARFRRWPSFLWRLEGRLKGIEFLGSCDFLGRPLMSVAPKSRVVIGEGVRVYSSMRANPLGCFQPCVLRTMAPGAQLLLGRNV